MLTDEEKERISVRTKYVMDVGRRDRNTHVRVSDRRPVNVASSSNLALGHILKTGYVTLGDAPPRQPIDGQGGYVCKGEKFYEYHMYI